MINNPHFTVVLFSAIANTILFFLCFLCLNHILFSVVVVFCCLEDTVSKGMGFWVENRRREATWLPPPTNCLPLLTSKQSPLPTFHTTNITAIPSKLMLLSLLVSWFLKAKWLNKVFASTRVVSSLHLSPELYFGLFSLLTQT